METLFMACFVVTWFFGYMLLNAMFERIRKIGAKVDEIHAKLMREE